MLTVIANKEKTDKILFPPEILEDLGIKEGEEIEFRKRENGEIVLQSKSNERKQKILQATREVIKDRESALIELGKGHE